MNELKILEHGNFGKIGLIAIDGKLYFPATKCAEILGYAKPHNAISMHCRYPLKQGVPHPQNPDKIVEVNFIPESDLYRLIARSHLPEAVKFEAWIFDEVLPSICKHGAYIPPQFNIPKTYQGALRLAADFADKVAALEAEKEENAPLIAFAEQVKKSKDSILVRELAKLCCKEGINIGEIRLYRKLREWEMIMPGSTEPYQKYVDNGYFETVEVSVDVANGVRLCQTTRVLPKGQIAIIAKLRKESELAVAI